MKSIFLSIVLSMMTISTFAVETIVYVNPNSLAASDENAGTSPESPWLTLNPTKWTDNMTIHLANGTYTIQEKISILNDNITLIGESRSGVILQSMDDAAFAAETTGTTLFQLSGKTASLQTMTIKNVRNNILKLGGAFDVIGGGNLSLNDITLTNLITAQGTWEGGGAIMVRGGILNVDNCTFEACQSNFGGAIMTFTNATINANTVNISKTRFINNANPKLAFFSGTHYGGAIVFSGEGTFNVDQCYFEGNQSKVNTSNTGTATGGAIMVRLNASVTSNLNITNSVFYRNESDGAGSVLAIAGNGVNTSSVFNLKFSNNVFYQNKGNVYSGTAANTLALNSAGVMYTGTFILANNTFFQNYNADRANSSSIQLQAMPVSAYFINNLMNDNEVSGVTVYGLACLAVSNSATLRRFKGNIFNHIGGALSISDPVNYPDLFESNINATNGNRSWINNGVQNINEGLTTPSSGLPYLETLTGGMGINFGVDEFPVNLVNVVPATDIRGKSRNGITDAGAFEFEGIDITTALNELIGKTDKSIIFRNENGELVLDKTYESVKIFNLSGSCLIDHSNRSSLDISDLTNGLYIIRTLNDGIVNNQKFIKKN